MTFGATVLRFVLGTPRTMDDVLSPVAEPLEVEDVADDSASASSIPLELIRTPDPEPEYEPLRESGFADIEAAVAMVSSGLTKRVVLTAFPSWPGLLWRAYELADEADVLILPTVVRPGGFVDIVVTSEAE